MKSGTRNSAPVHWRDGPARRRVWISVLAVLLAFTFLGMRGIWDPDEGRYTNVALNMLDSGDWLEPHRHHETGHWTKPPLTYWAIAASVAAFGRDPWAARLPAALAYLLSAWLAWRIAVAGAPGDPASRARPLTLLEGLGFQFLNPKAWMMGISAISLFSLPGSDYWPSLWGIMSVFPMAGLPVCFAWVLFGHQLSRWINSDKGWRRLNGSLGALTALCVVMLWY